MRPPTSPAACSTWTSAATITALSIRPSPASPSPSAPTSTAHARRSCPTAGTKATPSSTRAPRYGKALTLARLGILPFFLLACTVVWLWGRKLLGDWGALAPVFLFTNIPPVLAHAGLATMDMAIGAGICTALFTYTLWLEEGTLRRAIFFGIGLALAVLSKFSAVLLLPVCIAAITLLHPSRAPEAQLGVDPRRLPPHLGRLPLLLRPHDRARRPRRRRQGGIFAKIPTPLLHALETLPVPAPQLLDGLWQVHNHVDAGHTAYLLGRHSFHGWWYFFPVALAVKTPLAILLLAGSRRLCATPRYVP